MQDECVFYEISRSSSAMTTICAISETHNFDISEPLTTASHSSVSSQLIWHDLIARRNNAPGENHKHQNPLRREHVHPILPPTTALHHFPPRLPPNSLPAPTRHIHHPTNSNLHHSVLQLPLPGPSKPLLNAPTRAALRPGDVRPEDEGGEEGKVCGSAGRGGRER